MGSRMDAITNTKTVAVTASGTAVSGALTSLDILKLEIGLAASLLGIILTLLTIVCLIIKQFREGALHKQKLKNLKLEHEIKMRELDNEDN
jgi:hypothetical protein